MASAAAHKTRAIEEPVSPASSSVPGLCLTAALKHNKEDALNQKIGKEWVHIPAEEFVERVRTVALGLAALGIKPGDRIALLSENRPEWSISDMAIHPLGFGYARSVYF